MCAYISDIPHGKITSSHNLFYNYLFQSYDYTTAKNYLDANQKAIESIETIIQLENIDCDFERQDNYIYTQDPNLISQFKDEVATVNKLGFQAEFVEKIPLPIDIVGAVKFPNQAQFHPRKYALGLANSITNHSGQIYEHTKVLDVKKEDNYYLTYTNNYSVKSKYIVLASHYPIINFPGFYFVKMYQSTSYVVALDTHAPLFDGMYINEENPTYSFRTALYDSNRLLLIAGSDHKTGIKKDLSSSYTSLIEKAKSIYPNAEVKYTWRTEDCIPLDKIPYIGDFSEFMPNIFVATGFKKWGMTGTNIAAHIICDKILGHKNEYEDIFRATRLKPVKNYQEFGNVLKQSVQSLVIEKFKIPKETLDTLNKEEGKIIEISGQKIGVYRDKNDNFYGVKPICSHLGCELSWNNLTHTWDCPCHGSIFSYQGKSLYDPSIKDLEVVSIE